MSKKITKRSMNITFKEDDSYRPLAKGIAVSNNTRKTQLNNNDLILGISGSGKTGSYIVPALLSTENSIIVSDTKGNLYNNYKASLEARGFEVHKLDFTAMDDCECGYDPLKYVGRYTTQDGRTIFNEQDILSICSTLSPADQSKEPFWGQAAQMVLSCLIAFTLENFDEQDQNMATVTDVFKLMVSQNNTRSIQFLEEWQLEHPDSFASKRYQMFKDCLQTDKTWGCICTFVSNSIALFDFYGARKMTTMDSTFRFQQLGHKKSALFVNVSDCDRSMDRIVSIFYTQLFQTLIREADKQPTSRLPVPVRIMLDDFGTNFCIQDFDKVISVIRSRGIYASVILQSLCQLESAYSVPAAQTIIGNADHILYLGGTDVPTAKYVAERVGKDYESIMRISLDQMYILERGGKGMKVDKIRPYSYSEEMAEQMNEDCADTESDALSS